MIGHGKILETLKKEAHAGRLHHAQLFVGPEHVGKTAAALRLAVFLQGGEENVIVKQWGKIREFDFPIKNHAEIATVRGWIDKERAANVAGSRFAYLK